MPEKSSLADYVSRNQEPLTAGNYNDVDALLFAELSYCKFEKAYGEGYENKTVTVQEFAEDMLDGGIKLSADEKELLELVKVSERYENCTISNLAAENEESQWAAMTVHTNDGSDSAIIAMRGTDSTELGWAEDFQLGYDSNGTRAQELSKEYLENCDAGSINLTGHSKGGNDVLSAYAMASEETRDSVNRITNFDGPGVNEEFQQTYPDGYAELEDKLVNYYPENSVIGQLLTDNPGENHYISAEVREAYEDKGVLGEHDGYAFQIDENGFEETQQSELSRFVNETLDKTLADLSNEERTAVLDVLIEKYGVPAMIAGDGETPFSDNRKIVEEALDLWFLPESVEKDLASVIIPAYSFIEGLDIYNQMSNKEKEALIKLAGLLINYGAAELGEVVVEKGKDFTGKIKQGATNFRKWCGDRVQALAEAFDNFVDRVEEKTYEICNDITDWIRDGVDRIRDTISGRGTLGERTHFGVHVSALTFAGNEMQNYAGRLRQYYSKVDDIQDSLKVIMAVLNFASFVQIKNQLIDLANTCNKMSVALENIAGQYERTEQRLIEECNLP